MSNINGGDKQNIRYSRQHIYASRELQVGDRTLENNKYYQYTRWMPWTPISVSGTGAFNLISNQSYFCVDNNIITYNLDFTVDVDTGTSSIAITNPVYPHTPIGTSFRNIILFESDAAPGIQGQASFISITGSIYSADEAILIGVLGTTFTVGPEFRITGQASYRFTP